MWEVLRYAHERGRDLAERAADDDSDCHVDHVAFQRESLEFFQNLFHRYSPYVID